MKTLAICIPISRDLSLVRRLISSIEKQEGRCLSQIDISLIVAFNSAELLSDVNVTPSDISTHYQTTIIYEERKGYVHIRNSLVNEALNQKMDAIIFVDDDEQATQGWLNALIDVWITTNANLITGPVKSVLPYDAPQWAKKSRIFDTWKLPQSGTRVRKAYTNNIFIHADVLKSIVPTFDSSFNWIGSEDVHFSRQILQKNYNIFWCNEAVVEEFIPYDRLSLRWLAYRYYRNGLGDSLSMMKIYPCFVWFFLIVRASCTRFVCGALFIIFGVLFMNYRLMIKGYTRVFSAAGSSIFSILKHRKRRLS